MLLNKAELAGVQSGERTLFFRRWRRPTIKSGGTLNTSIGLLAVERVIEIQRSEIQSRDATRAGFASLKALLAELDAREGNCYRIELRYAGPDPRLALRNADQLADVELAAIGRKLARLDETSPVGPWTRKTLRAIEHDPRLAAEQLALKLGVEKEWLKTNVRKLKNLGLTISRLPGYELSPRGVAVLAALNR